MLSEEKLAEQYAKTRVFVLSSSIENHASLLKEAMLVGTPSIATFAGGVPEYMRNGENGFGAILWTFLQAILLSSINTGMWLNVIGLMMPVLVSWIYGYGQTMGYNEI